MGRSCRTRHTHEKKPSVLLRDHRTGPAGKAWTVLLAAEDGGMRLPTTHPWGEPPRPSVGLVGSACGQGARWRGHSLMRLVELGALKKSGRYSHLMSPEFMGMAWLQRHG